MSKQLLLSLLAIACCFAPLSHARVSDNPPPTAAVDVFFSNNPDTEIYLAEISLTLEEVRAGKMGEFSNQQLEELEQARITIFTLLNGKAHVTDLAADERISVYNAQEQMHAIISGRPQRVCKPEAQLGTRVRGYTCMTVEQHAIRTQESQDTTRKLKGYGF